MIEIKEPEVFFDNELKSLCKEYKENDKVTDAIINLGTALNLREYSVQAIKVLETALANDPQNDRAWYELIFSVGQDRKMQKLAETVENTFKDNNSFLKLRNLAFIYRYLGNIQKSTEYCSKLLEHPDRDYTAYEVSAYLLFWQNDFARAKEIVTRSLKNNPDNVRSWRLLGHCYFEEGDFEMAEQAYKKALEINQYYYRGWYSLGQLILNNKDRLAEGYRCLSRAKAINPYSWNSYFTLINFFFGYKYYTEAMSECRMILNLNPDKDIAAEALSYLGLIYYTKKDYSNAMSNFKKALEKKPDSSTAYYYLGQIFFKEENSNKALEYFQKAMDLDETFAWPYTQTGFVLIEQKKYKEAQEKFNKALEIDDEEYWAHMGLADIYRKQRKSENQLEVMIRAAEIADNDSDVQNRLGIAYECNDKPNEAENAYLRSLEIDPLNRKAANNLGYLYEKMLQKTGKAEYKEKAITTWKKRLLICRDTGSSMKGAINHLQKLDVRKSLIDKWIEIGELDV